jgi:hypothetical protein
VLFILYGLQRIDTGIVGGWGAKIAARSVQIHARTIIYHHPALTNGQHKYRTRLRAMKVHCLKLPNTLGHRYSQRVSQQVIPRSVSLTHTHTIYIYALIYMSMYGLYEANICA